MSAKEPIDSAGYEKDLWELETRHRQARRLELIFRTYSFVGVAVGLIGAAFFFAGRVQISLRLEDRFYLLLAGTGFGLAILSWAFLYLRKVSYAQELERGRYMSSASEFLLQWLKFENAARARLAEERSKANTFSVREIVSDLTSGGTLSAADAAAVEEAVRFRNFLVHSGRLVPAEHLTRMTKTLRHITTRLAKDALRNAAGIDSAIANSPNDTDAD